MKVTQPYQMVLLKRGEGSKTPLCVLPHEVDILIAMHGEHSVEFTDIEPPIREITFDTNDEYTRLQGYYIGDFERPNPTVSVFRKLNDFENSFRNSHAPEVEEVEFPRGRGRPPKH